MALEERVRAHPLVAQCVVVGNNRPFVAALVTLDPEAVAHWLTMRGKPRLPPAELVHDADLEKEIRRAVVAANTLVSQAESIRTFRILAAQFTEERGPLTPSLKLKRRAIEATYAGGDRGPVPGVEAAPGKSLVGTGMPRSGAGL